VLWPAHLPAKKPIEEAAKQQIAAMKVMETLVGVLGWLQFSGNKNSNFIGQ